MKTKLTLVLLLLLAIVKPLAAANDMDLVKEGHSLTAAESDRLETGLRRNANDRDARLKLLGYYAGIPESIPTDVIRARRADHILWLIQKNPKSDLFQWATAVWKIFTRGNDLADPQAFERAKSLWQAHVKANPGDDEIRSYAASFLKISDPETAESLLTDADSGQRGQIFGSVLLGIISEDYKTGEPNAVDESSRSSDYAVRILAQLRASNDPELLGGAGFVLAVHGGMLYADGKTSWDYTLLASEFLTKALALAPNHLQWYAVSTTLPQRGERPPRVIRVGAAAIESSSLKQTKPIYPEEARRKGIKGTVTVDVVIGLDGKVVKAVADSGPPELIAATLEAVSGWEYKPTLLGGKPVFIIARIGISYR